MNNRFRLELLANDLPFFELEEGEVIWKSVKNVEIIFLIWLFCVYFLQLTERGSIAMKRMVLLSLCAVMLGACAPSPKSEGPGIPEERPKAPEQSKIRCIKAPCP